MSELRNAIVMSVDRLRAEFLGCYGNTWIATPAFNRLATESLLFDEAHAAGLELADFFREAWGDGLIRNLTAQGVHTVLITDDAEAARAGAEAGFDEISELPSANVSRAAEELEETHVAGILAAATEQLDALHQQPYLAWIHLGSLGQTWDAPREFRERYHEEDDEPPPTFVTPPVKMLPVDFDPDERWGYALAYAAQVSVFDACLDHFLEHIQNQHALFTLYGVRGYPLGEHRRVGPVDGSLLAESLHVPWIVRLPQGKKATHRSHALVTPRDLAETVSQWCRGESLSVSDRERLEFQSASGETAIRTPDWFLRRVPTEAGDRFALYAKPDDRWEVNDVHDRAHEAVEELLSVEAMKRELQ